jgi:EAL domain-containing protein (putative c-di-GMP-specific phosphodiesterase class I)/GGDEF domain-containing protein
MNSWNLESRLVALAITGVTVAGLAHAGWLALLWAVGDGAGAVAPWWPLAAQGGLTLTLALAVGWQCRQTLRPLQASLELLRQQADALEQGRFLVVADPPLHEAVPLARSLNAAVRRMQAALDSGASAPASEVLRRSARSDPATGLDSRYTFLRRLTERLADRQSPDTAVMVVRLLPSASVSSPGAPPHDEQTLADLAELMRVYPQQVRGSFVGRLADGDFGLCLPAHALLGDSAASLMAAAQASPGRLRCVIGGVDHLGGVSLGSALALLDMATARAEGAGVGRIEIRSARNGGLPDPGDCASRKAIVDALRGGHIKLGEYPVLDRQGRLLHLECPMRLRLSEGGDHEPAEVWLAVAARYRLLTQIDLAGLELALAASAADGQGRCIHVAAESLATAGFVSAVRARLEAAPEAASRLWIEIAEVSFERLPPRLRNAGTVWRRCGARVGIEHAGAALRSLVRLGELDLDYVKVDPSFVQGLAGDAEQRERARGLVAFVHEFGARVIAEGADDDADLAALWALGFDGATGRAATRQLAEASVEGVGGVVDKPADQAADPAPQAQRAQAMSPA